MTPRKGVTLTEVLVSIFIMGIGLLSLLVLFPLGAVNMAQAIKDERVTMAAQNAFALARLNSSPNNPTTSLAIYPLSLDFNLISPLNLYTNPGSPILNVAPAPPPPQFNGFNLFDLTQFTTNPGICYPVYVDPQGVLLGSSRMGFFATTSPQGVVVHPGFARANVSFITLQPQISKFLTTLDDMTFTEDGIVDIQPPAPGGSFTREGRYSWAYMFRGRPSGNPPFSGVDAWVVLYEKRSLAGSAVPITNPAGAPNVALPLEETSYPVDYTVGNNVVTLHTAGLNPPALKKGTWVMDATILGLNAANVPVPPTVANGVSPVLVGGQFYRVASATDNGNGAWTLELQTPVQPMLLPGVIPPSGVVTVNGGVMVVMESVVEVFKAP